MKLADLIVKRVVKLSKGGYFALRTEYRMLIEGHINEYLYSDNVRITAFRNSIKRAVQEYFYPAFNLGLVDGGGESPAQGDDLDWINAKAEQEWGYIDLLFDQLKALKKQAQEEGLSILEGVAAKRAENYAKTLDGVYNEGKLRGAKDVMLTFGGTDGQESCGTCQKLKGKRHRKSWWINHGLTIFRGNENYDCGCYNCQHFLFDDKGNVWTA